MSFFVDSRVLLYHPWRAVIDCHRESLSALLSNAHVPHPTSKEQACHTHLQGARACCKPISRRRLDSESCEFPSPQNQDCRLEAHAWGSAAPEGPPRLHESYAVVVRKRTARPAVRVEATSDPRRRATTTWPVNIELAQHASSQGTYRRDFTCSTTRLI